MSYRSFRALPIPTDSTFRRSMASLGTTQVPELGHTYTPVRPRWLSKTSPEPYTSPLRISCHSDGGGGASPWPPRFLSDSSPRGKDSPLEVANGQTYWTR